MSLESPKFYSKIINSGYLIAGIPRSGTSIIGKIISTTNKFEYLYDPKFLDILLLKKNLSSGYKKILLEQYLVDDFFYNSLGNRRLNLNKNEMSSSYYFKDDWDKKLDLNKLLFYKEYKKKKLLVKMVGMDSNLQIQKLFSTKIILIIRNPYEIILSLKKKKWFSQMSCKMGLYPLYYRAKNNLIFPFWLENKDKKKWMKLSELNKYSFYVMKELEKMLKIKPDVVMTYENFLSKPEKEINKLKNLYNFKTNKHYKTLIKSVKRKKTTTLNYKINTKIKDNIDKLYTQLLKKFNI